MIPLLQYISGPIIGGIVGYVTNYLAIKMLFRPYKPIMIGRHRLPFTPGIVPKRKDLLAEMLGRSIVDKFFNADDLEIVFTSEAFIGAFADGVVSLLTDTHTTLGELGLNETASSASDLSSCVKDELCVRIQAAILRSDLSRRLAEEGLRAVEKRLGNSVVGKVFHEQIASVVTEPLISELEKYILHEGRSVILPILEDELRELGELTAAEVTFRLFRDRDVLHAFACRLHQKFMKKYVRHLAESVDVGGMITEKVQQMSALEIENLVVSVVSRELKYVVFLGALIGMMIGTINIFI